MINTKFMAIAVLGSLAVLSVKAQDLSQYREFQFGMTLPAVAKQTRLKPSDAIVVHRRPAIIQELLWEALSFTRAAPRSETVKDIQFSFYNGGLFRLVINYDQERTEGMTVDDIIEAISAKYGVASRISAELTLSSTQLYTNGEKNYSSQTRQVLARWEDAEYCFDLFQASSQSAFGLLAYKKKLNELALVAIAEAIRLDEQEAPQREFERQKKRADENRLQLEKARRENKGPFRP